MHEITSVCSDASRLSDKNFKIKKNDRERERERERDEEKRRESDTEFALARCIINYCRSLKPPEDNFGGLMEDKEKEITRATINLVVSWTVRICSEKN
jgi:hypothetical protein